MSTIRHLAFEHLEERDVLASIVGTEVAETLTGTQQGDSIFGLGGDDVLYGLGGNDSLRGGDGDDLLYGGVGNDILYSDSGADTFIFGREPGARDTIKDFDPFEGDRISFSEIGVDVYYDVLMGSEGAEIVLANNQTIILEGLDAELLNTHHVKFGQQGLQWLDWSHLTGNKYRYAPAGVQVGNSRYVFHCGNLNSGNITDYIMMRKDTLIDGVWQFDSEQVVLSPGAPGSWDGRHVCDPSITRGSFFYQDSEYLYSMFYLGFDHDGGGINQIGFALANSLEGPWVKVTVNDPLVGVPPSERNAWGVGQPSATSIDGGTVLLVYTRERPGQIPFTFRQVIDLSTAESPVVTYAELRLTTSGLTKTDGTPDPVNHGGAIAYDPQRDRFWIIRSMHPFPADNPSYIAPALQIASIPASHVWNGGGTWEVVEELHSLEMGTDRVFDGGFLRNEWGQLNDPAVVQAIASVALSQATTGHPVAEWTYRTHIADIYLDIGPADFNRDGSTNNVDLDHWRDGYTLSSGARKSDGDADGDSDVDGRDLLIWQRNYERIESSSSNQTTAQSRSISQLDASFSEDSQSSRTVWWPLGPNRDIRSNEFVLAQRIKNEVTNARVPREEGGLDRKNQSTVSDTLLSNYKFEAVRTTLLEHDRVFESIGRRISLFPINIGSTLEEI